jgi:hypothetical protein
VLGAFEEAVFETVRLNPRDPVATPIVPRMDELFASTPKLAAKRRVLRRAMSGVRKEPSLSWMRSVGGSNKRSPARCPPVHSARPASRSHFGGNRTIPVLTEQPLHHFMATHRDRRQFFLPTTKYSIAVSTFTVCEQF